MDAAGREALERELEQLRAQGKWEAAATSAIRGYGPEILGVLAAMHGGEDTAGEVFGQFCEDLWRGLPAFAGRSSFRTWAYTLARNASYRYRKKERRQRHAPISQVISRVEAQVRQSTLEFLKSSVKTRFQQLRLSLPEDDQLLLVLRVDKGLGWDELVVVMGGGELDEPKNAEAAKRESARLRKRFQLVKERLRELAREAGLIPDDD